MEEESVVKICAPLGKWDERRAGRLDANWMDAEVLGSDGMPKAYKGTGSSPRCCIR